MQQHDRGIHQHRRRCIAAETPFKRRWYTKMVYQPYAFSVADLLGERVQEGQRLMPAGASSFHAAMGGNGSMDPPNR